MSTNIKITVDQSNLTLAAKLIQEAARKAQQQKENDKKLEDQATKAAELEQAKRVKNGQLLGQNAAGQGGGSISNKRDAQDNPLFGSKITTPTVDRRPAANRVTPPEYFLLQPSEVTPVIVDGVTYYNMPTKASKYMPEYFAVGDINPTPYEGVDPSMFEAEGGPIAGTNAVRLSGLSTPNGNFGTYAPYQALLYSSNSIEAPSKNSEKIKDCTLEYIVKLADTLLPQQLGGFAGFRLNNGCFFSIFTSVVSTAPDLELKSSTIVQVREKTSASILTVFTENVPLISGKVQVGKWYHLALVKKNQTIFFFVDGTLASSLAVPFEYLLLDGGASIGSFSIQLGVSGGGPAIGSYIVPTQPVKIHGARFTTKALYTENFTPPTSL